MAAAGPLRRGGNSHPDTECCLSTNAGATPSLSLATGPSATLGGRVAASPGWLAAADAVPGRLAGSRCWSARWIREAATGMMGLLDTGGTVRPAADEVSPRGCVLTARY